MVGTGKWYPPDESDNGSCQDGRKAQVLCLWSRQLPVQAGAGGSMPAWDGLQGKNQNGWGI